jgi:hypothetical protein
MDIGEDTGTPVLEEYAAKMPFRFTGTLNKLVIRIEPTREADRKALAAAERRIAAVRE